MVELEPAWVLHTRKYRETSLLVDLFTLGSGRCRVIAKGIRRGKRNQRAALQPFRPVLISAIGISELKTLTAVEESGPVREFTGVAFACGLYLNELILTLLPHGVAAPAVFAAYGEALAGIASSSDAGPYLRIFEMSLLDELGLAPDLDVLYGTASPLSPNEQYGVCADGVVHSESEQARCVVAGAALIALSRRDYSAHRGAQRRVLAALLEEPLGYRTLRSRELLNQFRALHAASMDDESNNCV